MVHFPSGATGYIAFRNLGGSNGTRTTYIDDINVHLAPSCDRIEGFTVSGVTAYTADIHIVDPTYEANYVIVASSTTDTVTTTATDTLHTVVGLQPNTEYTFTVYTICSHGSACKPCLPHGLRPHPAAALGRELRLLQRLLHQQRQHARRYDSLLGVPALQQ